MGVASRRKADALIAAARVSIDGKVVTALGTKADPRKQEIAVDGVPLDRPSKRHTYYLLNKPRGVVTTLSDPEGRPTVRDLVPARERIFPVGRLDYDSEGALLLTTDGDLAHRLMHPRYQVQKTYLVKVKGKPTHETLKRIRNGIRLPDGFAKPVELVAERETKEHSWFRVTVAEGRNHLIKRLWLVVHHPVIKLIRTNFAGLTVSELRIGESRMLRPAEVQRLYKQCEESR